MPRFQAIAITGASSGLGRALALALAAPDATLHLTGRDPARLAAVAATCRALGATATATAADVTDRPAMQAWIETCGPIDLLLANAGVSGGPGAANMEDAAQLRAIFATNIDGVFNAVLPALAAMRARPPGADGWRGRIAIIGSVAGLIALPTAPAYSAAKAALNFWVSAAAPGAARDGIGLSIVRPGFIRTPMTAANPYRMPGLMDADAAAAKIIAGLAAGRTHITFPRSVAGFARFGQMLPKALLARLPGKPPR